DGKVAVEANLQAAVPPALGSLPKLAVGEPLAEEGEVEALAVALNRGIDRLGVAVAQVLRPEAPIFVGLSGRSLEGAETAQRFAARSCEGMVARDHRIAWPRRAETGEGRASGFERRALGEPHLLVLDIVGLRSGGELGRQRRDRGVQRLVARQPCIVERVDEDRIDEPTVR